jgi:hypothetical protein
MDKKDKKCDIRFYSDSGLYIAQMGSIELEYLSYSKVREMAPIYIMGNVDPRTFSRGKRQIAGSIKSYIPLQEGSTGRIEAIHLGELKNGDIERIIILDAEILEHNAAGNGYTNFIAKEENTLEMFMGPDGVVCGINEWVVAQQMTAPTKIQDFMDIKYNIRKVEQTIRKECKKIIEEARCECGADACGFTTHSSWCCKYKNQ